MFWICEVALAKLNLHSPCPLSFLLYGLMLSDWSVAKYLPPCTLLVSLMLTRLWIITLNSLSM